MVPAIGERGIAVKPHRLQTLPGGACHGFYVAELVFYFFCDGFVKVGWDEFVHNLGGQGHFCVESAPWVRE